MSGAWGGLLTTRPTVTVGEHGRRRLASRANSRLGQADRGHLGRGRRCRGLLWLEAENEAAA